MSQAVVLRFESSRIMAVVARPGGPGVIVDAAVEVPLEEGGIGEIAGQLADALALHKAHRLPVVLAVSRDDLQWQSYEVPPAPAEELPDMVLMQAARDFSLPEDGVGVDFLPLSGSAEQSYRVLTIGMSRERLRQWLAVCDEAGLKVRRVTADCFGWPSLMRRQLAPPTKDAAGVDMGLAVAEGHAELWASQSGSLKLIRSVHLPSGATVEAMTPVLNSELRRTLLSLSQLDGQPSVERLQLYGDQSALAERLAESLPIVVDLAQVHSLIETPAEDLPLDLIDLAPLAALAADEGDGVAPPIDLLHPRRRPQPPSRIGIYGIAGGAAALLLALIGWRMYRNVVGPIEAADAARAQAEAHSEVLAQYEDDQAAVDQIDRWLERSVDLLPELENLATRARVSPLDAEEFPAEQDIVVNRLEFDGRTTTVRALARETGAVQPFETRLRESNYRVDRGIVNPDAKALPPYNVSFEERLQKVDNATAGAGS